MATTKALIDVQNGKLTMDKLELAFTLDACDAAEVVMHKEDLYTTPIQLPENSMLDFLGSFDFKILPSVISPPKLELNPLPSHLKYVYLGIIYPISDSRWDPEKTTFTCPFGTFAYRRMPFDLCNAPATFQRCMLSIFSDMIERFNEVSMDDFFVFGESSKDCLDHLNVVLKHCVETNLTLSWEKSLYGETGNCVGTYSVGKRYRS
ncbi:hypothetical protein LIER_36043 [Lithospermum erythrorhizon]|uniref:Reverse transcriptase domain-containing protein n=1 Tax=Lithospermum erythrorhizon TaxID=34254 RepID=A0AAV3P1I6_LITER